MLLGDEDDNTTFYKYGKHGAIPCFKPHNIAWPVGKTDNSYYATYPPKKGVY